MHPRVSRGWPCDPSTGIGQPGTTNAPRAGMLAASVEMVTSTRPGPVSWNSAYWMLP